MFVEHDPGRTLNDLYNKSYYPNCNNSIFEVLRKMRKTEFWFYGNTTDTQGSEHKIGAINNDEK